MTLISDSINIDFKPFDIDEKIAVVQDFFADAGFSHFPVLDNDVYLGCISADDADGFDIEKNIGNYRYTLDGFFARTNMVYFDVMQIFAKNHTNVVPVLGQENQYMGYYELQDVTKIFSETPFMSESGHIMIVEKDVLSASMSQIVQIIESNSAQLLGCFVSESTSTKLQVTLKIGLGNINEILQSFRRYEYEIVSVHEEDVFIHDLKERSQYLEKYLSM